MFLTSPNTGKTQNANWNWDMNFKRQTNKTMSPQKQESVSFQARFSSKSSRNFDVSTVPQNTIIHFKNNSFFGDESVSKQSMEIVIQPHCVEQSVKNVVNEWSAEKRKA